MTYNWQLWDNFEAAAEELGLELRSDYGGCVIIQVPKEVREKFYVMCWTPLNKLDDLLNDYNKDKWRQRLRLMRDNCGDFHLEFGAIRCKDGHMNWFPNLASGKTPSKQEIVDAVKTMLDIENFEKNKILALLKEEVEEF